MATTTWLGMDWRARRRIRTVATRTFSYLFVTVLALLFAAPFIWMASMSLQGPQQYTNYPPEWIPNPFVWENYWNAWNTYDFTLYTINTVWRYAVPATLGTILSSAIVAYGFARLRWPGRETLFALCLATMMVPFQVRMVPLFIIFKQLGWIDSFRPLVVPAFFGAPFQIFMLRQFFLTIPEELSDAARIDGASELGILLRIILPLAQPALAVVALLRFLAAWNDYMGPLIYLHKKDLATLALGIANMRNDLSNQISTQKLLYPYLMAVSTMAVAPILLAFFFAQRAFIEGISLTGIKG